MVYSFSWSSAWPLWKWNERVRNILLVVSFCHRRMLFFLFFSLDPSPVPVPASFLKWLRFSWPSVAYSEWWWLSDLSRFSSVDTHLWWNIGLKKKITKLYFICLPYFCIFRFPVHFCHIEKGILNTWGIEWKEKGGFMRKAYILSVHSLFLVMRSCICIFNTMCYDEGVSPVIKWEQLIPVLLAFSAHFAFFNFFIGGILGTEGKDSKVRRKVGFVLFCFVLVRGKSFFRYLIEKYFKANKMTMTIVRYEDIVLKILMSHHLFRYFTF